MACPPSEQDRFGQFRAIQNRVVGQYSFRVLADQVTPGARPWIGRVRDREPAAWRTIIREHVQAPVAARVRACLCVKALLYHGKLGRGRIRAGQVREPEVVARSGAARRGHHQPMAVPAHRNAVVVGLFHPRTEDHHVLFRSGADLMQVDAAVVLGFARWDRVRWHSAHVVEGLSARQPRHRRVAGPVDRAVHRLAIRYVHDPKRRLLVAALRQLVRQQPAFLVGLPGIERGGTGRVDLHRVDQHSFAGVAGSTAGPGRGHADQQDRMLLCRGAAHEELTFCPPGGRADIPGTEQFPRAGGEPLAAGPGGCGRSEQFLLVGQPGASLVAGSVFQPSVGVRHQMTMEVVG